MQVALIANPTKSGDPSWGDRLVGALARAGLPGATWLPTTAADPGPGQARAALDAGAELVVVAGGDGTVRQVVTVLSGTEVPLALLPAGTGNLLARNLGVPLDVGAAARVAASGTTVALDVGRLDDGACFAVMAGTGFDAALLRDAPAATKAWLGWPAYLVSGARLLRGPAFDVEVEVDGVVRVASGRGVLVANVGALQGGLRLLPGATPYDGLLDVAVLAPTGRRDWAHLAGRVVVRRTPDERVLTVLRGRRVVVRATPLQPVQLDGDLVPGARALSAQVVAGGLHVRVPQERTGR